MSKITEQQLLDFGMVKTEEPENMMFPYKKMLIEPEDKDDSDFGELALAVTQLRNTSEFCLILPDGAILYLQINSIAQLEAFENSIQSYEYPY